MSLGNEKDSTQRQIEELRTQVDNLTRLVTELSEGIKKNNAATEIILHVVKTSKGAVRFLSVIGVISKWLVLVGGGGAVLLGIARWYKTGEIPVINVQTGE